jgi:hypothetical protein
MSEVRVNIPLGWSARFIEKARKMHGQWFLFSPNWGNTYCFAWKFDDEKEGDAFYQWAHEIFMIEDHVPIWWLSQDVRWKKPGHESDRYLW